MNIAKSCVSLWAAGAALVALGLLPCAASAQTQDNTSVADAARKAREQKKNTPKTVRTLTNDDLTPAPASESKPATAAEENQAAAGAIKLAEGEQAAAQETNTNKPAANVQATDDKSTQRKAELEAALKRAKANLAESEHELDVLQRLAVLDSDAHYSKTDYQDDTEGKAKLDADNQQIGDKKTQIAAIKAKIAQLMDELGISTEPEKPAGDQPK